MCTYHLKDTYRYVVSMRLGQCNVFHNNTYLTARVNSSSFNVVSERGHYYLEAGQLYTSFTVISSTFPLLSVDLTFQYVRVNVCIIVHQHYKVCEQYECTVYVYSAAWSIMSSYDIIV